MQADDVEADVRTTPASIVLKKMLGRAYDAPKLGAAQALRRMQYCSVSAVADLDDHQRAFVQHYEIEFARAAAVVGRDMDKASLLEPLPG